jgi:hypothetical protein
MSFGDAFRDSTGWARAWAGIWSRYGPRGREDGGRTCNVPVTLPWRCLSSREHHQPWFASQKLNDISAVEVAYTKVLNVCTHSCELRPDRRDLQPIRSWIVPGAEPMARGQKPQRFSMCRT